MLKFREINLDHGTPKRESEEIVSLKIDGFDVTVPKGTSIMRAASQVDIKVPKLCATDSLEPFGSCRVCLVEIEGKRGFPASCTHQLKRVWLFIHKPLNYKNSVKGLWNYILAIIHLIA